MNWPKELLIAPKAGCHQILFHSHYMMVPCLLLDKVMVFDCQKDFSLCILSWPLTREPVPATEFLIRDHKQLFSCQ
ncbi:MAG: hypothetical protein ACLR0U_34060 [Enterocloster clostridioformis]